MKKTFFKKETEKELTNLRQEYDALKYLKQVVDNKLKLVIVLFEEINSLNYLKNLNLKG